MKDTLDFIVIGAQKAGTTSLFEHLRHHPQISLPTHKEAPYFDHDPAYAHGWQDYMERIALLDPERQWGTVTPTYMIGGVYKRTRRQERADSGYDERTVPLRIRERLPDVRLVAILRDPVERARSHHQMMVMNENEQRSFDTAIDELLQPEILEQARMQPEETSGYVTWGEYRRILGGYFDVFPAEQILVTFTDELDHHPEQLLARVHEFLGVRSDFLPDNLGVRYRTAGTERRLAWISPERPASPQGVKRRLKRSSAARRAWNMLPGAGRASIKRNFDQLGYRTELWNRRPPSENGQPSQETVQRLREHFTPEADELAALLSVSPPWRAQRNGD